MPTLSQFDVFAFLPHRCLQRNKDRWQKTQVTNLTCFTYRKVVGQWKRDKKTRGKKMDFAICAVKNDIKSLKVYRVNKRVAAVCKTTGDMTPCFYPH